jgi:hypothetical protein
MADAGGGRRGRRAPVADEEAAAADQAREESDSSSFEASSEASEAISDSADERDNDEEQELEDDAKLCVFVTGIPYGMLPLGAAAISACSALRTQARQLPRRSSRPPRCLPLPTPTGHKRSSSPSTTVAAG